MLVTSDSDSEASFRVDFGRGAGQDFNFNYFTEGFIVDAYYLYYYYYLLIQPQQRRASFASTSHAWQL